jgi:hypothetical protein
VCATGPVIIINKHKSLNNSPRFAARIGVDARRHRAKQRPEDETAIFIDLLLLIINYFAEILTTVSDYF